MTQVTTPVAAGTLIGDLINGILYGRNLIAKTDGTLVDPATSEGQASSLAQLQVIAGLLGQTLTTALPSHAATDTLQTAGNTALAALASSSNYLLVSPSDSAPLAATTRAITIGAAGNLTVKRPDGALVGPIPVQAGQTLAIAATYIMAAGTTATGILAQF